MQGKTEKKATEIQKTARGFFHGCLSVFVFSPYFFRLLLCSAGSAECSFPIKHIPLRVRKLCFHFDVSRKFLHCDIWLFLYKFQNIVVLFFCKNCFPASQLRSGLITASACTLFYKAVYGAFIYWKIFCNFPGIMSFIPGLQYQFSSFICKGTALFKRFVIIAFHQFFLTLPTAKAGGFLFLPLLHWRIPYGTAMSYTVSTSYVYPVPVCPAVQLFIFMQTASAVLFSKYWCLHSYPGHELRDTGIT